MKTQTMQFAIEKKNNIVKKVGRSAILQPKTNYKAKSSIKWYEDKLKKAK